LPSAPANQQDDIQCCKETVTIPRVTSPAMKRLIFQL
jgi:hypothetical protein